MDAVYVTKMEKGEDGKGCFYFKESLDVRVLDVSSLLNVYYVKFQYKIRVEKLLLCINLQDKIMMISKIS